MIENGKEDELRKKGINSESISNYLNQRNNR